MFTLFIAGATTTYTLSEIKFSHDHFESGNKFFTSGNLLLMPFFDNTSVVSSSVS